MRNVGRESPARDLIRKREMARMFPNEGRTKNSESAEPMLVNVTVWMFSLSTTR
jgi:hypothetical protein